MILRRNTLTSVVGRRGVKKTDSYSREVSLHKESILHTHECLSFRFRLQFLIMIDQFFARPEDNTDHDHANGRLFVLRRIQEVSACDRDSKRSEECLDSSTLDTEYGSWVVGT